MKIGSKDILTPANILSVSGLALVFVGSTRLSDWSGFVMVALGRLLDIADGYVARRTHTSDFGAAVDAIADKLSILLLTTALFWYELAPLWVLGYILGQNALVAVAVLIASHRKIKAKTSVAGKRNMFLQNIVMLIFACTALANGNTKSILLTMAYLVLGASFLYAFRATRGYIRLLRKPLA